MTVVTEQQVLDRIKQIEKELRQLRRDIYESEIFVTNTENEAIQQLVPRERRKS